MGLWLSEAISNEQRILEAAKADNNNTQEPAVDVEPVDIHIELTVIRSVLPEGKTRSTQEVGRPSQDTANAEAQPPELPVTDQSAVADESEQISDEVSKPEPSQSAVASIQSDARTTKQPEPVIEDQEDQAESDTATPKTTLFRFHDKSDPSSATVFRTLPTYYAPPLLPVQPANNMSSEWLAATLQTLQTIILDHETPRVYIINTLKTSHMAAETYRRFLRSLGIKPELMGTAPNAAMKLLFLIYAGATRAASSNEITKASQASHVSDSAMQVSSSGLCNKPIQDKLLGAANILAIKMNNIPRTQLAKSMATKSIIIDAFEEAVMALCDCPSAACQAAYLRLAIIAVSWEILKEANISQKATNDTLMSANTELNGAINNSKLAIGNLASANDKLNSSLNACDKIQKAQDGTITILQERIEKSLADQAAAEERPSNVKKSSRRSGVS